MLLVRRATPANHGSAASPSLSGSHVTHTRTFSADGDQDWTFSTTNDDHVHHDPLEPGDILKGGSAKMTVINQGAYLFLLFYVKNLFSVVVVVVW